MFIFMDAPQHPRLRRLLTGQFTVKRMKHLEDHVRELAVQLIDTMRAEGAQADLVQAFALPLPSLVICELLGVDYGDRSEFHHRTAIALDLSRPSEERRQASGELRHFMAKLVGAKRRHLGDDIVSGLIHEDCDPPLTDRYAENGRESFTTSPLKERAFCAAHVASSIGHVRSTA